jgi:hypothetical protein
MQQSCVEQQAEQLQAAKKRTDKLTKLWTAINGLIKGEFTGYIKINFTQGIIGRIEKFEEILKK